MIFDVGANIGLCSLHLSRRLENLTLVAVEPATVTFETLQHNLSMHMDQGVRLHTVKAAIGSTCGETRLVYFPHAPGNSTTRPEEKVTRQS